MAVSEYDKQNLSAAQQSAIDTYTKQWEAAKASGDTAGMQAAHDAAEAIRATAGYSGGSWGNSYTALKNKNEESDYALTDFLRQQSAANTQKNLVALKDAYERNMATYKEKADTLPQVYEAGRNSAAAQDAIERKNFDERAVANGLNTGTTGQAELARESTYRGQLADLDREQANAAAAIERQQAALQAEYENAIAAAKASGDATLANALYQELIRVENLEREDAANQQAAALAEQQNAQNIALKYGLVNPTNIGSIKSYDDLTGTTMGQYLLNGSTGTGGNPGKTADKAPTATYDNGGLTTDQVKALQKALGVTQDGKYGSGSKKAAGGLDAKAAYDKYVGSSGTLSSTMPTGSFSPSDALKTGLASAGFTQATGRTEYQGNALTAQQMAANAYATDGKQAALGMVRDMFSSGAIDFPTYTQLFMMYNSK